MAEVIDKIPDTCRKHTVKNESKYAKYLDGRVWRLELGVDCSLDVACVRVTLFRVAKSRGVELTVLRDGREHVVVQATKPAAKKK